MTRDAKMMSQGTFEPCENGTNDPVVQWSLSIFLMFLEDTCLLSKAVKANSDIFIKKASMRRRTMKWTIKLVCNTFPNIIV